MSRASEDLMDQLHALTAGTMLSQLQKYRDGLVTDGEGNPLPVPPSLLAAVSKYLKDNGVDRAVRANDDIDKLADILPSLSEVVKFPGS